jgi:hypothetical protein
MNLINKGDRILIAGDSWGCGEWKAFGAGIAHLGLELYLTEYGCSVTNVSVPGCSNLDSVNSLKTNLENNEYDVILWIQTDPIRDLRPYDQHQAEFALEIDDFLKLQDNLLTNIYNTLNNLGPDIICMGGCSAINIPLIKNYSKLNPVIPGIIEFFGCESPPLWVPGSRWLSDIGIKLSKSIVNYMYETDLKWERAGKYRWMIEFTLDKKWFFPDGHHPNRHALKKIFEYLIDFKLPD